MNMKKLIAMLICLFSCCLFLASCEEPIGGYLDDYYKEYKPETIYNVMYDFYVIYEDGTDEMAKSTVNEKINQLLGDKYNTKLNMIYLTEDNYEAQLKVDLGLAEPTEEIKKTVKALPKDYTYGGKIVLINDVSMLDYLGDKLADLKPYLATTDFGTLNTQINAPLLAAADVDGKKLAIPNNRIYGEYKYICINRAIAETKLNFSSLSEIPAIKSDEDVNELLAAYAAYLGKTELTDEDVDSIVRYTNGQYDVKGLINAGNYVDDQGRNYAKDANNDWMCNVVTYPTATLDVAYASAYGIIPSDNIIVKNDKGEDVVAVDYVYRAMDVIYSFNDSTEMHNLLCYGVPNTNYRLTEDDFVNHLTEQGSNYYMNLEYCGDIFRSYYSNVWTKEMETSGLNQIKESVLFED